MASIAAADFNGDGRVDFFISGATERLRTDGTAAAYRGLYDTVPTQLLKQTRKQTRSTMISIVCGGFQQRQSFWGHKRHRIPAAYL